jgi:hypothetical protein
MTNVDVRFNTDRAGFISQECPSCRGEFKVQLGKGSKEPIAHCPYCAHDGRDCWWTQAQARYLSDFAAYAVVGPELERMARRLNSSNSGGMLTIKTSVNSRARPSAPVERDEEIATAKFACCGEAIRHRSEASKLRCIICGKRDTATEVAPS